MWLLSQRPMKAFQHLGIQRKGRPDLLWYRNPPGCSCTVTSVPGHQEPHTQPSSGADRGGGSKRGRSPRLLANLQAARLQTGLHLLAGLQRGRSECVRGPGSPCPQLGAVDTTSTSTAASPTRRKLTFNSQLACNDASGVSLRGAGQARHPS